MFKGAELAASPPGFADTGREYHHPLLAVIHLTPNKCSQPEQRGKAAKYLSFCSLRSVHPRIKRSVLSFPGNMLNVFIQARHDQASAFLMVRDGAGFGTLCNLGSIL